MYVGMFQIETEIYIKTFFFYFTINIFNEIFTFVSGKT